MSQIVNADAHHRLGAIAARVKQIQSGIASGLYELGLLVREVRDTNLWRDCGYASFSVCVEESLGVSRRTAFRALELAVHFGPDIAERYGSDKLLAMHRYLKVTARDERPGDLLATDIQLRGEGGLFESLPIHRASTRQIQEATRLLQQRKTSRLSQRDAKRADRAERLARLSAALPGKRQVRVRAAADGKVRYDFSAISEEDMLDFIEALRAEFGDR